MQELHSSDDAEKENYTLEKAFWEAGNYDVFFKESDDSGEFVSDFIYISLPT